jgi:hypothetical protein
MSDMSDLRCLTCGAALERVRYFSRQLLTADDLCAEQDYFREKLRRHNRYLHGWGVVCGCEVEPAGGAKGTRVRVCPGYAISPAGDEICIGDAVEVDLRLGAQAQPCAVQPCPPLGEPPADKGGERNAYIAVRYAECYSRPLRVFPAGCGCDEMGCEYSRVRESFEIKVLWQLPASHREAARDDAQWCSTLKQTPREALKRLLSYPVPPCPSCTDDPWVVLATITLPQQGDQAAVDANDARGDLRISFQDRRVLLSTQRLQVAMLCVPD